MLKIATRNVKGVTVLDLKGRLVLGDSTTALHEAVRSELEKGSRRIVLNLGATSYVDSAGFGELVGSYAAVLKHGGEMRCCSHKNTLLSLMELTKLNTLFEVFESESEALKNFPAAVAA